MNRTRYGMTDFNDDLKMRVVAKKIEQEITKGERLRDNLWTLFATIVCVSSLLLLLGLMWLLSSWLRWWLITS